LDIKQQIHFGRRIVEGEKKVKIFGEEIAVNAEVVYIDGYSGHADQKLLMNFVGEFKEKPKKIFLVHGEEEAQNVLKGKIEEEYGIDTEIPSFGDSFRVDEIVEKEENLLEKEKVVATREEKIEFANKVADLNEEISMLSDTIADRMTHVHVKSEELTTNTDKTILEQVLSKLNKLELAIQLMLNQAEKNCNDKEETEQKEKEEKQEKKSSKSKNKKKDEEIDDIDDII
jgi:RNA-metabolizing metallo-beta-lactamase